MDCNTCTPPLNAITRVAPNINNNSSSLDDIINQIFNKLEKSDFISLFFLVFDTLSPKEYLEIVKGDKNTMENTFKYKCLVQNEDSLKKDFLIELLGTLKKYNLLKILGSCRHMYLQKASSFNNLNKFWKCMYDVCESCCEKEVICLQHLLPDETPDIRYPEITFVQAYEKNIFSALDLTNVYTAFSQRPDIVKKLTNYTDYYALKSPTSSSPCGIAVILNHMKFTSTDGYPVLNNREDSFYDVEALEELWKKFGFKTEVFWNLNDEEVVSQFKLFAAQDHSAYDAFVACYMSHGDEGIVYASNCKPIEIRSMIDIMSNQCSTLIDKPKLFFIQACQGNKIQQGVSHEILQYQTQVSMNNNSSLIKRSNTPKFCDVVVAVSSVPGYVSFAPCGKKSWFIESLYNNMKKYGHELDVRDIIVKVTKEVADKQGLYNKTISNCKQTVCSHSTFRKNLVLKRL